MAFICGYFRNQGKDNCDVSWPFSSTSTRKSTRRRRVFGSQSYKNGKNPYADHGLDKFEALLVDLDHKRHKILTQIGSEDVSMVKFIYRSHNELKPIVVMLHNQKKHHDMSSLSTPELDVIKRNNGGSGAEEENTKPVVDDPTEIISSNLCKRKIGIWWKPQRYFPLIVILILVLLMFSRRSFAILCTSISWYLVPIINENFHNLKQSSNITRKKLVKRLIKRDR